MQHGMRRMRVAVMKFVRPSSYGSTPDDPADGARPMMSRLVPLPNRAHVNITTMAMILMM